MAWVRVGEYVSLRLLVHDFFLLDPCAFLLDPLSRLTQRHNTFRESMERNGHSIIGIIQNSDMANHSGYPKAL